MENSVSKFMTVAALEGTSLSVVGDTYRIVITGNETKGAYAVIDMLVPPKGGPGPHSHAGFQEAFYVLSGEVEVKTESQTYIARTGSFVNIPLGGMVHRFKNISNETAHLLCIVVPAGLEDFFQEIGKPVPAGSFLPPPPMDEKEKERLNSIAEKYDQKLFPPDYLD